MPNWKSASFSELKYNFPRVLFMEATHLLQFLNKDTTSIIINEKLPDFFGIKLIIYPISLLKKCHFKSILACRDCKCKICTSNNRIALFQHFYVRCGIMMG